MEIVNIIVLFFLEILLLSIETEDLMEGSHSMSNTGLSTFGFCCN